MTCCFPLLISEERNCDFSFAHVISFKPFHLHHKHCCPHVVEKKVENGYIKALI